MENHQTGVSTKEPHAHEHSPEDDRFWTHPESLLVGLAGVIFLWGVSMKFFLMPPFEPIKITPWSLTLGAADFLLLVAMVVGGSLTFKRGLRAVLNVSMSIDFLISLAVLGALVLGKYVEAASLAVLYGVAERLEDYSIQRAQDSLKELLDLSPREAILIQEGEEVTKSVEEISVGDTIAVRPGEKIPMDGTVTEGRSSVNQSPVTGESMPVGKQPGDEVFAGTFNQDGYLEVQVDRRANDNTLAKIVEMVKEAEASKAPSQQFVDTFAAYYTPTVVSLALFVGVVVPFIPGITGGFSTWWLRAMALLVIACPCGLLISTPVTVVSGISTAAGKGTLIKGGAPFEDLGQVEVICFDKTGTLSEGNTTVSDVHTLSDLTPERLMSLAAAVESRSEHHLADAILDYADTNDLRTLEVSEFEAITASGVSANIDGTTYYVGKPELMGSEPPGKFRELEQAGKTAVCVGTSERILGVIGISDRLRDEARDVIGDLHEAGIEVVMITGDNERTARTVAETLGINHFHSGLLPEDKVNEIERLRDQYGSIAMVGDGINDAPALAKATVGIAMGAAGSDTAIDTADIALMGDDLNQVTYAVRLSQKGERIIKQNIVSSIGIKLLLALGVIPGFVDLITAVLIGDMGVTFGITANALRLRHLPND